MKVVAIIQARMGSTRLPGKVLKDIAGKSMLARVVERTRRTPGLSDVVVATTTRPEDDPIVKECQSLKVHAFRGSEKDVLERYYRAAKQHKADTIIRITSDCPLIDPDVVGKVLQEFKDRKPDYASNALLRRTYPRGLDTEVFTAAALHKACLKAGKDYQREHVTPYIYENSERFRLLSVEHKSGNKLAAYRWTVDTAEDLSLVQALYQLFDGTDYFSWLDVIEILKQHPALNEINRHIVQKPMAGI